MPKVEIFEKYWEKYEVWFEDNRFVYESELQAVKELMPQTSKSIEIGVGSGRFAYPLGINLGIDPAPQMRVLALRRGITTIGGVAEAIPFKDARFDLVLMVTTLCYLDNVDLSFREIYRVLSSEGVLIIAFFDRGSSMGKRFIEQKRKSLFFREARFYSVAEVTAGLEKVAFQPVDFRQTLFRPLAEIKKIEPVAEGSGDGLFVVIKARK